MDIQKEEGAVQGGVDRLEQAAEAVMDQYQHHGSLTTTEEFIQALRPFFEAPDPSVDPDGPAGAEALLEKLGFYSPPAMHRKRRSIVERHIKEIEAEVTAAVLARQQQSVEVDLEWRINVMVGELGRFSVGDLREIVERNFKALAAELPAPRVSEDWVKELVEDYWDEFGEREVLLTKETFEVLVRSHPPAPAGVSDDDIETVLRELFSNDGWTPADVKQILVNVLQPKPKPQVWPDARLAELDRSDHSDTPYPEEMTSVKEWLPAVKGDFVQVRFGEDGWESAGMWCGPDERFVLLDPEGTPGCPVDATHWCRLKAGPSA